MLSVDCIYYSPIKIKKSNRSIECLPLLVVLSYDTKNTNE